SPAYFQFVDEEGQGDLGELVGDELVGEPAFEGHQVVGSDGSGDRDAHSDGLLGVRNGLQTAQLYPPRSKSAVSRRTAKGPAHPRGWGGPVAFTARCAGSDPSVEGVTAGAGVLRARVVDREALLLDRVHEVDGGAHEVGHAVAVDGELDPVVVGDDVSVERALVEVELVAQSRAASGRHS